MRRTHLLTLAAVVVLLGVALFGWWYLTIGRWPLVGARSVNFGEVALTGGVVALQHEFALRNRTSRPLVIQTIRPSCGCTPIDTSGRLVEAGGTLRLPVTFNLSEVGPKNASLTIVFDDQTTQTLWLRATGRRTLSIQVLERSIDIGAGREGVVTIMARVQDSDDPPPLPELDPPDGVVATFGGWEAAAPRERRRGIAALWRGSVRVSAEEGELTRQGGYLVIGLPGQDPFRVLVRGEPVRTAPPPMDFPDDL